MEKPLLPRNAVFTDGTLGRCPFCHDTIGRDARWVVCEQCLARHHAECWTESRECACCQYGRVLGGRRGRFRHLVAAATLVLLGAGGALGGWIWLTAPPPPRTVEQVEQDARVEGLLRALPGAYTPANFRARRPFSRDVPGVIARPVVRSREPIVLTFDANELEGERRRWNELDETLDDDLRGVK